MRAPAFPILMRTLHDLRWHIGGYGIGLGIYAALLVAMFPAFSEVLADIELPAAYQSFYGEAASDLSRPSNFFSLEFFSLAPLILSIYAAVVSTGVLAGEESRGTTELLLSLPVTRTRVFVEKLAGLVIGSLSIALIASAGWAVSVPFVDLHGDVGILQLMLATVLLLDVPLLFVAIGLLLGAAAPSRGVAGGILAALIVFSFLASSFATLVRQTEWLRYLSPFYYGDSTELLNAGPSPGHLAVLAAASVGCAALALLTFRGREVGVASWQPRAAFARSRRSRHVVPGAPRLS